MKELDVDLSDLAGSNPTITAAILLHQREQDQGAGIVHNTGAQKALWIYYQQMQAKQAAQLGQAAYLTGFVKQVAVEIKALVDKVDESTDRAILEEVYRQVSELDQASKAAQLQLERLENG